MRADGTGNVEHLLSSPYWVRAASWSPNGQILSFIESHPVSSFDIYLLRLNNDHQREEFLVTSTGEFDAEFSPDGEWIAHTSNESGQAEVYVRHVSGTGRAYQISPNGGEEPIWSKLSDELFYRVDDKWMAVAVTTQPTFTWEDPTELFQGPYLPIPGPSYGYDARGDRFLLVRGNESKQTEIRIVLNWLEELKRLSPRRKH
jgi:Tol biopolymer transport system component